MLTEEKKKLRMEMRTLLKQFDKAEKQKADERICQKLLRNHWIQKAELVLCYYSMPDEADTLTFISEMLRQGKKVALPVCENKGIMQFHRIENLSSDEIAPDVYGIPAPVRRRGTETGRNTIMIVPALAFTETGERLGQGGGYYDRYLSSRDDFHTIGICYAFMLLDRLPSAPHDCRVDKVITDK